MSKDVLHKESTRVITLADGKKYKLSPVDLNFLATLEEVFDCETGALQDKLKISSVRSFRKLLWTFLHEGYPELTIEDVGRLVALKEMGPLVSELTTALEALNG